MNGRDEVGRGSAGGDERGPEERDEAAEPQVRCDGVTLGAYGGLSYGAHSTRLQEGGVEPAADWPSPPARPEYVMSGVKSSHSPGIGCYPSLYLAWISQPLV